MSDRDEKLKVLADHALDLGLDDVAEVVRSEMRLWKLSRCVADVDYDEYSECVVVAATEDAARTLHPNGVALWSAQRLCWVYSDDAASFFDHGSWPTPGGDESLKCECVGFTALPAGTVVCASFNAG